MLKDIRTTALYQEAYALYATLRRPGSGRISEAAELHVGPDGRHAVFSGTLMDNLQGSPPTRICLVDLLSGDKRVLTFGPNVDRSPKYSPNGKLVAFLSDRNQAGDFQLFLLDTNSGASRATPVVDGWVEYLHWSPNGRYVLLGVAGHGADISGGQGAISSRQMLPDSPSWLPNVDTGDEEYRWRCIWVYDLEAERVRQLSPPDSNVWEATWCGDDRIAAVVSPGPSEGLWYTARLHLIELDDGRSREIYKPRDQLGWPAASPSGRHLAMVEAVCSDRWVVAGELRLIDTESNEVQRIDTHGVDVTCLEWRSDRLLLVAGHRDFESVVSTYEPASGRFVETWSSRDVNGSGRYMIVSGLNEKGDCALVGEGFTRAPEIATIRNGSYSAVSSFDLGYGEEVRSIAAVDCVTWRARDGLDLHGWLLRPVGNGPHPLILYVHGGPVTHWAPMWLGRPRSVPMLLLVKHGYAVFFPNPRGSAGRGLDFARHVLGDMGGADTYDYLSGLDYLVAAGVADQQSIGVIGVSYGGFMASWLITQDSRFAAAVVVSPVTNHVTEHLISNIPHFVRLFLNDEYSSPTGKYFWRSPIMHAHKTRTPTLNICGALDRCTPPEEAIQFHNAIRETGVESALVTYPEEGHGIRKFPAAIDYAARVMEWFATHMPAMTPARTLKTTL